MALGDLGKATRSAENVQIRTKLKSSAAIGLALQYNPPALPMRFRVSFDYTLNSEAVAQPSICTILSGAGCRDVSISARFFALSGDIVFAPQEVTRTTHLYFLLGLGLKRHEFGGNICPDEDIVCSMLNDFVRDQTRATVHLALGVNFKIGPVHSFLEAADYMSRFEPAGEQASGQVQQDLFVITGLRLPLFW